MVCRVNKKNAWMLMALLTAFSLAACQTPPSSSKKTPAQPAAAAQSDADRKELLDLIDSITDPCALQMQDISAAMLLYYNMKQKLPASLEELRPYAAGVKLQFTCPTSKHPYIYIPEGLSAPGTSMILVLYDATAIHKTADGDLTRWGIVFIPSVGNQPVITQIIRLSDEVLNAYLHKQ